MSNSPDFIVSKFPNADAHPERDYEYLVSIMQKYSAELKHEMDQYDDIILRMSIFFISVFVLVGVVGLLSNLEFVKYNILSEQNIVFAGIIGFCFVSLCVVIALRTILRIQRSIAELKRTSEILTRLDRRASQLIDRGDLSFGNKVLLEVATSEAESLINRSASFRSVARSLKL